MKAAQIGSIILLGAIWYGTSRSSLGLDKEKSVPAASSGPVVVPLESQERITNPETLKAMAAANEYVAGEVEYRQYKSEEPNQYFIQAGLKYVPEGGLTEGGLYIEMFVSWKRDENYIGIVKEKINDPKASGFIIEPKYASSSQIETFGKGILSSSSINSLPLLKIEIDQTGTWKIQGYPGQQAMQKNEDLLLKGSLKKLSLLEADKFIGTYEGKIGDAKIRMQISKQGGRFLSMVHRISNGYGGACKNVDVWVRLISENTIAFNGGDQNDYNESSSVCYSPLGRAQIDNEGNLNVADFRKEGMQGVFKKMK